MEERESLRQRVARTTGHKHAKKKKKKEEEEEEEKKLDRESPYTLHKKLTQMDV